MQFYSYNLQCTSVIFFYENDICAKQNENNTQQCREMYLRLKAFENEFSRLKLWSFRFLC